jgi:hypothetical protein
MFGDPNHPGRAGQAVLLEQFEDSQPVVAGGRDGEDGLVPTAVFSL